MQQAASPLSLPNLLTIARIVAIPVIVVLLLAGNAWALWTGFFLYVIAAVTDWLDGYLARRLAVVSPLGRMLDPIADKLLVCVLVFVFAWDRTFNMLDLLPAIGILMREVFVSGLREFLGTQSVVMNVSRLAKYKTTLQLVALGAVMITPVVEGIGLAAHILMWAAGILTVMTGYDYLRGAWPHLLGTNE